MSEEGLNKTSRRIAYDFYHRLVKKNNAAVLNSEQQEAQAEDLASKNKHLFLHFAKMEQDIKILLDNIEFMINEDDANLDPEDKAMIAQIRADYKS